MMSDVAPSDRRDTALSLREAAMTEPRRCRAVVTTAMSGRGEHTMHERVDLKTEQRTRKPSARSTPR